jgi:oxysterol-binding protein-related protein 8
LKPFNPILGEVFECSWKFNGHQTDFFSEQVSHHPPKSAFYFRNKNKNILLYGVCQPKAAISLTDIINNRASMSFAGPSILVLTNLKEEYVIDYPNVVVKGLFSGTTEMENGGSSTIKCKSSDLSASFHWNDKVIFNLKKRENYKER